MNEEHGRKILIHLSDSAKITRKAIDPLHEDVMLTLFIAYSKSRRSCLRHWNVHMCLLFTKHEQNEITAQHIRLEISFEYETKKYNPTVVCGSVQWQRCIMRL